MVNPTYGNGSKNPPVETLTGGFPIWYMYDDHGISTMESLFIEDVIISSSYWMNPAIWSAISLLLVLVAKRFVSFVTTGQGTFSGASYTLPITIILAPVLAWIVLILYAVLGLPR